MRRQAEGRVGGVGSQAASHEAVEVRLAGAAVVNRISPGNSIATL